MIQEFRKEGKDKSFLWRINLYGQRSLDFEMKSEKEYRTARNETPCLTVRRALLLAPYSKLRNSLSRGTARGDECPDNEETGHGVKLSPGILQSHFRKR